MAKKMKMVEVYYNAAIRGTTREKLKLLARPNEKRVSHKHAMESYETVILRLIDYWDDNHKDTDIKTKETKTDVDQKV